MEDFNFALNDIGVPLSLSSLGNKYVKKTLRSSELQWISSISNLFTWGYFDNYYTKRVICYIRYWIKISYYIANYKGGINESFMYGGEKDTL
jgi:hypothetical protein